jgi:hypothetical protein
MPLIDPDARDRLVCGRVGRTVPGAARFPRFWAATVARVSSLWTPGGEHRVPPGETHGDDDEDEATEREVAEAERQVNEELAEARRRVADVPVEEVVANHAMGLFELAAIHLSQQPANLASASLAIDALGFMVDGLGDRIGENAGVLRDALAQIRLAFVQVKSAAGG